MWSKYLFATVVSFATVGVCFVLNTHKQTESSFLSASARIGESNSQSLASVGPVRTIRFTVFDPGIRPAEMKIKAGWVNLLIEDKTSDGTEVLLQRGVTNDLVAVGRIEKGSGQFRRRNTLQLRPGKYQLSDSMRPANTAVLLVEP